MNKFLKILLVVLPLIILGLILAFPFPSTDHSSDRVITHNPQTRHVTLAGDIHYPPFEYLENNSYIGFNVDIMRAVADIEGWDLQIVPLEWKDAVSALANGSIDGIQGMVPTPTFQASFDFSKPYLTQQQAIFVHKDNETIHSLADLQGRHVGVQAAKVSEQIAKASGLSPLVTTPSQCDAMDLLAQGKVDAVLGNYLASLHWGQQPGNSGLVKTVGDPLKTQSYALAVHKGNSELLQEFNDGLAKITENGTYDQIQNRWFGKTITEKPLLSNTKIRALMIVTGSGVGLGIFILAWNRALAYRVRQTTADLAQKNKALTKSYEEINQSYEQLYQVTEEMVHAFGTVVEVRDKYTKHHSDRVAQIARGFAQELGLDDQMCIWIHRAGLLHDIGKIGIPEDILNKQERLTPDEYTAIQVHPQLGYVILQDIQRFAQVGINQMVLQHHERWDGSGYPNWLKNNEITFGARILALADAWDAMTSDRPYRPALSTEQAVEQIRRGAGTQFDPNLVEEFIKYILISNYGLPKNGKTLAESANQA